jgi:tyrosine-protein kinase Etk/Wzc
MDHLRKTASIRNIDFAHHWRHYRSLIWRWKWWLMITFPVVTLGSLIYLVRFAPLEPKQPATALIGIETNGQSQAPILDLIGAGEDSKAEIMRSNGFLKEVVSALSLQLVVRKHARSTVFDSLRVDSTAAEGSYLFHYDVNQPKRYSIFFSNKKAGVLNKIVALGDMKSLVALELPGMYLRFSPAFRSAPHRVAFDVVPVRTAMSWLEKELQIKAPDRRMLRYHIEVALSGTDYPLISQIVNTIADRYVQKSLNFRKRRTHYALTVLERQFETAREELSQSEANLKRFRTENPTVDLSVGAQQTITELMSLETSTTALSATLREALRLQGALSNASADNRPQVAQEVLAFLTEQKSTTATVLQAEITRQLTDLRTLEQSYAPAHPFIKRSHKEIADLVSKSQAELNNFINRHRGTMSKTHSDIQNLSQRLEGLPNKELQLAHLLRQQQVTADIYSKVLDKYNEAKVADAVEVTDVFVMDYAMPPVPPPLQMIKLLALLLLLGLLVAVGPMIFMDLITKTARSELELRHMTNLPVLECIPTIIPDKSKKKS